MLNLQHCVRVFVFQYLDEEVRYLLLRQKPMEEWPLGPVIGKVGVADHLQDAILRQVTVETGIRRPQHIIDLAQPDKELFGDMGLVQWPFAYQAGIPGQPSPEVIPGPNIGEFAWMGFEQAFQSVEIPVDRKALVKLQLNLRG
jgi:hypothetical protein